MHRPSRRAGARSMRLTGHQSLSGGNVSAPTARRDRGRDRSCDRIRIPSGAVRSAVTHGASWTAVADGCVSSEADSTILHGRRRWGHGRFPTGVNTTRTVWREPVGRRRRDRAVELPLRGAIPEDRACLGRGNTVRSKPLSEYAVQRHPTGPADRGDDRIPAGVSTSSPNRTIRRRELTLRRRSPLLSFTVSTSSASGSWRRARRTMKSPLPRAGGRSATIVWKTRISHCAA